VASSEAHYHVWLRSGCSAAERKEALGMELKNAKLAQVASHGRHLHSAHLSTVSALVAAVLAAAAQELNRG